MAEITAVTVGKLREMTNAGLMDCKKALVEANGDLPAAVDILRKKGVASAAKKAGREAKEGVIAQHILPGSRVGVLVEINCETDFVAKNETFRAFCDDAARKLATDPKADLEAGRIAAVARLGENIKISRHQRLEVSGNGMVAAYIHTGAKLGVLVEVGAGKESTVAREEFKQLVRDITLQIASAHPHVVSREQVPPAVKAKEEEIAREQVKNKPPQAIAKIVEGKLEKFYQGHCLVDQGFVKQNSEITVKDYVATVAKQLGDEIVIRHFVIEIKAGAAGRDLGDQLRSAREIFLRADSGAPAATGFETEAGVGLRCVVGVENYSGVGKEPYARGMSGVGAHPRLDQTVRFTVFFGADGAAHIDDSFDQFCLFQFRHRFVAAKKF